MYCEECGRGDGKVGEVASRVIKRACIESLRGVEEYLDGHDGI